jgi:hypothetical protein
MLSGVLFPLDRERNFLAGVYASQRQSSKVAGAHPLTSISTAKATPREIS